MGPPPFGQSNAPLPRGAQVSSLPLRCWAPAPRDTPSHHTPPPGLTTFPGPLPNPWGPGNQSRAWLQPGCQPAFPVRGWRWCPGAPLEGVGDPHPGSPELWGALLPSGSAILGWNQKAPSGCLGASSIKGGSGMLDLRRRPQGKARGHGPCGPSLLSSERVGRGRSGRGNSEICSPGSKKGVGSGGRGPKRRSGRAGCVCPAPPRVSRPGRRPFLMLSLHLPPACSRQDDPGGGVQAVHGAAASVQGAQTLVGRAGRVPHRGDAHDRGLWLHPPGKGGAGPPSCQALTHRRLILTPFVPSTAGGGIRVLLYGIPCFHNALPTPGI